LAQDGEDLTPEPGPGDHVRGSLDAPVVLTEFGDFECPFCGRAYAVIESVLASYGERVAFVFRNYPLQMHPHAEAAAEAAEAAGAAGKFWEMHAQLYEHQNALALSDLRRYAQAIGVDADSVEKAIEQHEFRKRIERDMKSGDASGIEGTPALFINGFAYEDEVSVEALRETIDRALAARGTS